MRPDLRAYLLGDDGRRVFGPGPVDLLERVGELGSLRAAAIDMGMAYTKATRLVRDAELAFGFPLTERTVGGTGGGGSRLTAQALDLIERYRAFERASRWALAAAYETCFSGFADVARLGCVVMASGEGTRFGGVAGEKLVAPLAGTPVLERTLAALPADLLDVVVVTRWDAVEDLCGRLGVRCVRATGPRKSDTMRAGLEALGRRAGCLFVTGDQPLLTEKSVRAMVAALTREPTAIVRLAWRGQPANPVLWPADMLDALARMDNDTGGRALLAGHAELADRVRLVEAADERELDDVDTREDLARLEDALTERGI
ncbi:NTP transferase domain-containing protein [Thermophilibacter sp. ET337]|uniref:NTP transferase domain-containing protein n=1 Tax=Thermophilibacter sp. ET337 TaxID=2973084 RepID=UPI0021AC00FB|nr:NTP transferase domain-containing protein [Thermophilibacter sp. ET337]MCR8907942.1 NTP transferase domain-containing protein [Thermophilibacter sp. ET337]